MNGRPTNSGRESDVSFPLDLEFIPEWQTELPQMVGEAGKEAVILTRLQLSSLGSESPPEFPPTQKRGKERGVQRRNPVFGWPTERSSFVTLNYCTVFARNQESRIERVRTKLSFVIVQQPKQNMGLPHVRAIERGQPQATRKSQYKKQRL